MRGPPPICLHAARFCGSCALTCGCWLLWLALAALAGLLAVSFNSGGLEVPHFFLHRLELKLASADVTARFGRTTFDPNGNLLIENLRLYASNFDEPLCTSRAVFFKVDFWPLLVGDFRVHEIRLTGASLTVPAMLSPSGTGEALIRDLDFTATRHGREWTLDQLGLRCANLAVSAHGPLPLSLLAGAGKSPASTPADLLPAIIRGMHRALPLTLQLHAFESPTLVLKLENNPAQGPLLVARFFAGAFHLPPDARAPWLRNATAENLFARVRVPLSLTDTQPVALFLSAGHLSTVGTGDAGGLTLRLHGTVDPANLSFLPQSAFLAARTFTLFGQDIRASSVDLTFLPLPAMQVHLLSWVDGCGVTVDGSADLAAETARCTLEAWLPAGTIARVPLPAKCTFPGGVTLASQLSWQSTAWLRADAVFGPAWKPGLITADAVAHDLTAHRVHFDLVRSHATLNGTTLLCSDVTVRRGEFTARGSYGMDIVNTDYRILLQGNLRPLEISPWFSEWWPRFWNNFDFTATAPTGDVDVQGRWKDSSRTSVFAGVDAPAAGIRTVPFDRLRTRLYIRPDFYQAEEFIADRAGRQARGRCTYTADHTTGRLLTTTFDVTSNLDLGETTRLFGEVAAPLTAVVRFDKPPELHVSGRIDGAAADAPGENVAITASSHGAFTFYGFPLRDLQSTARLTNGNLAIDRLGLGFAGGTVSGWVNVTGAKDARRLDFDGNLQNGDLGEAMQAIEVFQAARHPETAPKKISVPGAVKGRLNLAVQAGGALTDPYSYHGTGSARITNGNLGEIHLLGLLSRLLSGTFLNFTSLKLDTAKAVFSVAGRQLAFSEVQITGPTTVIDAKGDYLLENKKLDFTARLQPFGKSRNIFTGTIDLISSPLSSVLQVRLTGPLDNPAWSFVLGPTNLLREISGTNKPAAAPAPAQPATP